MARNLVNLENVSKSYGTRTLLDGVSLGVADGDRIGVVGRNGDGKSTLLRLLARARRPTPAGSRTPAACGSAWSPSTTTCRPSDRARAVVGDGPAHEWAAEAGVREVLGRAVR